MAMSSARGSRRGTSGGGDWKSNPIIAVLAALLILFAGYRLYSSMFSQPSYELNNFPYQFVMVDSLDDYKAKKDDGFESVTLRYNTSDQPSEYPFEKGGNWYWRTYVCKNAACPFLKKDKGPFLMPGVSEQYLNDRLQWAKDGYPNLDSGEASSLDPKTLERFQAMRNASIDCPQCATLPKNTPNSNPVTDAYDTEEGLKMVADLQKRILEDNK